MQGRGKPELRFSILGPLRRVKGQSDLFNPYPKHARAHDNAISRRQASPSSLLARAKKRGGASSPDKQLQNACESHVSAYERGSVNIH